MSCIKKINLYEMYNNEDIIFSQSARDIALSCKYSSIVTIDFAHIKFCSRSFLHTLFRELVGKQLYFVNVDHNVQQMMMVAAKDCTSIPEIWICISHNYIKVRYGDMK